MSLFDAMLLGIIQGLTEFVPISSTAHLLIGQTILNLPADEAMFSFLVLVQLGTLVSLVIYFWKDWIRLIKAFFARPFSNQENRLAWYIGIATLPSLLAGLLLKENVEQLFQNPLFEASIRLLVAAILMGLAEWLGKRARKLDAMTGIDAIIIGMFQVLSIFPGASRSGTTISGGMLRGFDRPTAARFAFLMSLPVMLAAGMYEMIDVVHMPGIGTFLPYLGVGFLVGWPFFI